MFARKKNYGRAGYVDDPLPNIVNMHCMALLCIQLDYLVVSDHLFFCLVCGPLVKH